MDRWVEFSKLNNIFLIEDCAQAHMAESNGKVAGSFGIAGAYSFYPTKNLGALGDAGIIVTSDEDIAQRSRVLRNYGQTERYCHPYLGLNSRLDEMQAAILSERIKFLAAFTHKRREIASRYYQEINNDKLELLQKTQDVTSHVHHLFVIKTKDRDRLQKYLFDCSIQTHSHYPIPIHLQESVRGIICDPNGLLQAESFANSCLSIPCHPQLSDDDVDKIIDALNKYS
jgi:dTDP-4-amino-4,6-dideoxygalactose transaminase